MDVQRCDITEALPRMQQIASEIFSPSMRHHPGQLAWSATYGEPEALGLGPVFLHEHAWAWLESPDWLEVCGTDVEAVDAVVAAALCDTSAMVTASTLETEDVVLDVLRARGFGELDVPWFTHHFIDLGDLPPLTVPVGYHVRAVRPGEHEKRAAAHRAAWSATSKVTGTAYRRLMGTAPYRPELDHVVVETVSDTWVASCCVWWDESTGVALVEPVGCVPEHRGRGLAATASVSALGGARDLGATTGLVCPRGDDDYPGPARLYRRIGFAPGARTVALQRPTQDDMHAPSTV